MEEDSLLADEGQFSEKLHRPGVQLRGWENVSNDQQPCHLPYLNGKLASGGRLCEIAVPVNAEIQVWMASCGSQSLLAATVQTAWSLVLSRYSGNEGVTFGYLQRSPEAKQNLKYKCVASFGRLDSVQSVLELLQDHFNTAQTCPDQIDGANLESEDSPSFNSVVALNEGAHSDINAILDSFPECALVVDVRRLDGGFAISVWCESCDEINGLAINIAHAFGKALESTIDHEPGKRIKDADLLSTFDQSRIHDWNSDLPSAVKACIHDLFHQKASTCPTSVAISASDGSLSYSELDSVTNRLASHLRALGVKRGSLVPLCFEKSMWMAISMMSVLKAGGAVVQMDAGYPKRRLLDIIQNTNARLVLSGQNFRHLFVDSVSNVVSDIPTLLATLPREGAQIEGLVTPNDPAFVLFTSGSTGKPKGLVHTHSSICSGVAAYAPALNLSARSRVLQFAAYSFDISVIDTIASLTQGACLCIPSEHERLNDITSYIQRSRASWAFLTPSFARQIEPKDVPTLTDLVLGGEDVPQDSVQAWSSDARRVMNGYGPAECAICVTDALIPKRHPTIGRGVGCLTWVLDADDDSRLVPLGCVGELCIEGPLIFQGYLNDAEKTNRAFLNDPPWIPKMLGVRRHLYKTGDLVRYNSDGTLIYIGRGDSQVKLRGQRIELGEVESHLRALIPAKKELAVEVVDLALGGPTLAAFITTGGTPMDVQILAKKVISGLSDVLPGYMVPSTFIPLPKLPMTQSNKVDRQHLRARASKLTGDQVLSYRMIRREAQTPLTRQERRLQALWTKVLKIASIIEASDHFFALGGDSLAAIALVSIARQENLRISVADIFERPVLADMALILSPFDGTVHPLKSFELLPPEVYDMVHEEAMDQCRIRAIDIEDIYPCTPMQEGLFALSELHPGTYIAQIVYEIPLNVDKNRFREAWDVVIKRNSVLRGRIIRAALKTFQVTTRGSLDPWQRVTDLDDYLASDKQDSMGLGQPLLRLATITLGSSHKFVLSMHHSIFDAWSLHGMWQEVEGTYRAQNLSNIVGFNNFVHFLKHDTASQKVSREYWRTQLRGGVAASFPPLPSDSYQPRADGSVTHSFELSHPQSEVTIPIVLRAAWAMLLAQYSGCQDVTFGMTLSGRFAPFPDIDRLIGPTIATVPVRVYIDPKASIHEFLRALQKQATGMIPHEQIGLQEIAKSSDDAQQSCRFSSLLVIQPRAETRSEDSPTIFVNERVANFEFPNALVVECHLTSGGVDIIASYDSKLLQHDVIERLTVQFEHVVKQLCQRGSDAKLKDVALISPEDLTKVFSWNAHLPKPEDSCLHHQIEFQALRTPTAEAVCAWDGVLTYSELDQLASRLASKLSIQGIGPEVIVPLCFDKSKWVIVSLLAVLKAGGACLYLEPTWPWQRIRFILDSVKASVVVAEPQYINFFESQVRTVIPVSSAFLNEQSPTAALTAPQLVKPSYAAFVMFTSGSTGTPKGIVQEHTALLTSARNHASMCNINSQSRVLQFSAFTFDVYIIEICTTLIHGGCVCVPSEFGRMNNLTQAMEELRVNWAFFTPTFCRSMDPEQIPSLRTLLVGGEAVDKATIDRWTDHVVLLNCYGPAECGPTTMCQINPAHRPESIGYPLCCVSWIVDPDDHNRLAPLGTIGELLLEGYTMARGYLNDTEKTAVSFVPAPDWLMKAGSQRGSRLYKTGDLVRYSTDGAIDFIGRKDTQVKVRGQRVELGEVEHHLRKCLPSMVDAAAEVVRLSNSQDRTSLVAFVCPTGSSQRADARLLNQSAAEYNQIKMSTTNLKAKMEDLVPSSMVPAAILLISNMPINSSGKLDRKRLKILASEAPVDTYSSSNNVHDKKRTPNTAKEKKMQLLWERVVKHNGPIFAEDHFFNLGADSITAMALVATARSEGLALSVGQIFKHPVLFEMASHLRALETGSNNADIMNFKLLPCEVNLQTILSNVAMICSIDEDAIEDIYPCTPLQEGLLALSLIQPGTYMSQNIYRLPPSVDVNLFRAAWDTVVQQEPILRTRVLQTTYGVHQAVVAEKSQWHTTSSFNTYIKADKEVLIRNGDPMVRLAIFPATGVDDTGTYFVLTLHHSIYDMWSSNFLWKAAERVYAGLSAVISPPFKLFIEYLLKSDTDACESYWRHQLQGANPTSFPEIEPGAKPLATKIVSHSKSCRLSATKIHSGVTNSTLLRAAWSLIVARYSMAEDVTFGAISNGRTAPVEGIDRIVAPLITTVPVRVRLDYEETVSVFLDRLQAQAVEMLPFEHSGLQNIKRYLDVESQEVCDLQNLLVIQPLLDEEETFSGIECLTNGSDFVIPHALIMICSLLPEGVQFQASFDPRIVQSGSVQRILSQFEHILVQISVSDSDKRLKDLDLLSISDKQEIMEGNRQVPETRHQCVHDIIGQRVEEHPNSTAICSWDGQMTYQRLNHMSNRLAAYLQTLGVKADTTVPLFFEKSLWTVVALLGVMKAGGAFVLVDHSTSVDRFEAIKSAVHAKTILTSKSLLSKLQSFQRDRLVTVNESEIDKYCVDSPYIWPATVSSNSPFNVSFTSGTTAAVPKAAVTEHWAYSTGAMAHAKAIGIGNSSRVLQFASYNFDSALVEILTPLMHGGCVCIPSESDRLDDLTGFMNRSETDLAILTPSVARAAIKAADLESLKTLILVGERMSPSDVLRYKKPGLRLLNAYGLTECCVCCAVSDMTTEGVGSIGKAIGSNFWVSDPDDHHRLAPVGTVGELLIEGPILAREYLNDEARTTSCFISNPFWSKSIRPMRLYKTGDLVRYNHNGTLTLTGRKDMQVKLRGQRIDLSEAERLIKQGLGQGVSDVTCHLISPADDSVSPALAAFVCFNRGLHASDNGLVANAQNFKAKLTMAVTNFRAQMLADIPSHMAPKFFIPVHHMPLLPSGKINRRKLAEAAGDMTAHQLAAFLSNISQERKAPIDEMEVRLASTWAKVLNIEQDSIGSNDSFLLWGDSISAIRLTAALREVGLTLSAAEIFAHPVLSDMASMAKVPRAPIIPKPISPFALVGSAVDQLIEEVAKHCAVETGVIQDIYPCTPLQEGLLALSIKETDSYVALNVLALPQSLDTERFMLAWARVIDDNPILRTRIVQTKQKGTLQVVLSGDVSWTRANDLAAYLDKDRQVMGFGDSLNRFALIVEPESSHLVWSSHHATYDGWSVELLFRQVDQIYHDQHVTELLPFNNYIQHLAANHDEEIDTFWHSQASKEGVVAFPALPRSSYRPKANTTVTYDIDIPRSGGLTSTNLYAAWALVSARYADASDIVFGVVTNGRTASVPGIDQIIGPTIATVPLRLEVERDYTIRDLAQVVEDRSSRLVACAHKGLQNIRKLSAAAEALCTFQTIVVIQPESEGFLPCGTSYSSHSSQDLSSFNNYGLMLEFRPSAQTLGLTANFDENLIEKKLVERILRQLGHVLEQFRDCKSDTKLCDVSIATAEDIEEVWRMNRVLTEPSKSLIHNLVRGQVERRGEEQAICAWDGEMTYKELDVLSSRLACHFICDLGIQTGSIIPLCFERSLWTVVCLLAVLKAGSIVLLLDPAHPLTRLHDIISEARAETILCDSRFAATLRAPRVVKISLELIRSLRDSNKLNVSVEPESPAFILSTSGSTGKPKLMVHTHQGISTSILAYGEALTLNSQSRVLQFAAYSFDISINEILATLFHGGCLCIPSEHDRMNDVVGCIRNMQVNWLFATPSFITYTQILPEHVSSLQTLVIGGEVVTQDLLDVWRSKLDLLSVYGPAECQICTVGPLTKARDIGFANGCLCWIVDPEDFNRLMPIGMVGELIIEGPVVAQGYLNAAGTSFSIKPTWITSRGRRSGNLYRTGDLVKYNSHGSMTYIGRKDDQVKLRGQRLEIGDVEYHLRAFLPASVNVSAAVIDQNGHPTLVAFIADPNVAGAPAIKIAREYLKGIWTKLYDVLPRYMVPKGFLYLESLPLTVSGKTDRMKLQKMEVPSGDLITENPWESSDTPYLAKPEQLLQEIWSEVLNIEKHVIRADSDFFRLGGDSILAIRLVSVSHANNVHLTVAKIFEHPKLGDMAKLSSVPIGDEDPSPFSMLDGMRPMILNDAAGQCHVHPDQVEDIYPCTPLQVGLFALSQRSGAYVARSIFDLPADLDQTKFKAAWEKTASLNEILRTAIVQEASKGLLQVVLKDLVRWSSSSSLLEYLEHDKVMHFGDCLTRFAIVEGKYFVLSQHHAAYDGYSLPQIFRQAEDFYEGRSSESKSAPYSRFVKYLTTSKAGLSQEYWTKELAGTSPSMFPIVAPDYQPNPFSYLKHEVGFDYTNKEVTRSTLIRAAWALVVSAYTKTHDVTFGAVLSGRQAPVKDIENMTGPTIATVPMRINVDVDLQVDHYLRAVQEKTVKMIPHEQSGLQHISKLSSDAKVACDFHILLSVHPEPRTTQEKSSIHMPSTVRLDDEVNFRTYALSLECTLLNKASIAIEAFFDSNVIDELQMMRVLHQFAYVLKQMSWHGDRKLRDIDLVSPQDKQEVHAWNVEQPALEPASSVHLLIDQRAKSQPDKPAICSWDGDQSYQRLGELSTHLAEYLCLLGVGPGVYVPLCFEKSLWMVVALLGVMKAGGCCVPLDPSHPKGRLLQIVEQVPGPIILTSSHHRNLFPDVRTFEVSGSTIAQLSLSSTGCYPNKKVRPNDLLYAIFTSGSTGLPKGVLIEHQAFCAGSNARRDLLKLDNNSRVLQFASYSFDVSLDDILSTLIAGGCVCIPSEEERMNNLTQATRRLNVNWANLTPSVASLLKPEDVPSLQILGLSGEPMNEAHIRCWSDRVNLMNLYGPTECSVLAVVHPNVTPQSQPRDIGRPVGCTGWVVEDSDHNRLAPIGTTGELLIEGPLLARGYLNDDLKTQNIFIENPDWTQAPKRLYKTGDLVRYNSDGTLTYVGRKDDEQIKITGQRVELGEIESHLRSVLPAANAITVSLIQQETKKPVLAGFIGLLTTSRTTVESMIKRASSQLRERLPSYMIPRVFIHTEAIPLTSAGKTDHRQLRELGLKSMSGGNAIYLDNTSHRIQEPSTELERQMRVIWADILNVPTSDIGVASPFFTVGGDSITAIQVVGRCRSQNIAVTTYEILQHKTIANICKIIDGKGELRPRPEVEELKAGALFELSPIQHDFFQLMPEGNNFFQQSFLLGLSHQIARESVIDAADKIVRSHSMLRSRFQPMDDGRWIQRIAEQSTGNDYLFSSHQGDIEVIRRQVDDTIDIEKGPVFAVGLSESGNGQALYLTAHHLVIDLVSWRIVLRDLEEILLDAQRTPAKEPLSFPSWSRLQAEYSRTSLGGSRDLPLAVPPANYQYWGLEGSSNTYEETTSDFFVLEDELSTMLLGNCNTPMRTEPVELFLAAIFHSFRVCFPDRGPPALYNEGHGREPWDDSLDLSRTVGWFTTMYPLNVEAGDDIADIVRRSKDARRSVPCNGWPWFTSRHYNDNDEHRLEPEIIFNYQGHYQQLERKDALFKLLSVGTPSFARQGSNVKRQSVFEVSVAVHEKRVRFDFVFNRHLPKQERIYGWVEQCRRSLQQIASSLPELEPQYTLNDFPLLPPHFDEFHAFIDRISPQLPSEIEDVYPSSPMQRKMYLSQASGSGCFQATSIFKATPTHGGEIDLGRLRKAWQSVVDRNSILRTCVMDLDHKILQIVLHDYQADLVFVGENEPRDKQKSLFDSLPVSAQKLRPMHRMTFSWQATAILCKLEMSHALMDGASLAILLQQLASTYDSQPDLAYNPGHDPSRNILTYKDFIQHLQTDRSSNIIEHWKTYLEAAKPCLFPSDANQSMSTWVSSRSIAVDLSGLNPLIHPFCKQHGITLSTLFQTVWSLVLRIFTEQDDVSFGYLVSGRDIPLKGIEQAIGPFFNLLCCHLHLDGAMTLQDALEVAQADGVESARFQDFSLPEIETDESSRLFNTLINFRKYAADGGGKGNASIAFESVDGYDPFDYDIVVGIAERGLEASIVLTYWNSKISDGQAGVAATRFRAVLERVMRELTVQISGLGRIQGV